ncbi:MAG TPA: hypothetical protein VGK06_14835, partial [Methanosarcina sp.]
CIKILIILLYPIDDLKYLNVSISFKVHFDCTIPASLAGVSPIIHWNETVIDGHNRYGICKKNTIEFTTIAQGFPSFL